MGHPIIPPPDLVRKWQQEANHNEPMFPQVAAMAAQWGADQELDACCDWMSECTVGYSNELRAVRRPKPQRLKEQALALIDDCTDSHGDDLDDDILGGYLDDNALSTIRRALEALPDD